MQQVGTTPKPATVGGRKDRPYISRFSVYATLPPVTDTHMGTELAERISILQRTDEINTLLRMLGEPQTSAVIMSGEPGVGKSTLAALLYHHLQKVHGMEADTSTVGARELKDAPQAPLRPVQGGIKHFVWLSIGPNATLPDVIAAILNGVNMDADDFFLLKPEQQIGLLVQALGRPQETAFIVLDQFEELLTPVRGETSSPTPLNTAPAPTGQPGRGAIDLFFEMLRDADIGTSRLLLTTYRSPMSTNPHRAHRPPDGVARSVVATASQSGSVQGEGSNGRETRIRSYLVSRISIPEGVALLGQRGIQGSHSELSLVWQRCGGHVFALVLFSILTSLSGFSLSYLLNSPDYAPMWNGEVTLNLIGTIYYYLNPIQRTLMRALCLFAEPVPLEAIATAIMGDNAATDDHRAHNDSPYMTFKRELNALVEMSLVQEQSKGIAQHRYFLHPLLRHYTVEHYLESSDHQNAGHPQEVPLPTDVLGVAAPPNPMVSGPEARQIALAAGHMRVAGYYAREALEYCPPREQRTGISDVEPILAMIRHLCLSWHWQEAYNLLRAEGLHESMLQWGALNSLIGLYIAMLPPLGVLSHHDFGEVCGQLGLLYGRLGDNVPSRSYYEQALAVFREIGDGYDEAVTLANEGELFRGMGEWEKARGNFEQALTLNQRYGDEHLQCVVLHNLGLLFQATKNYPQALRCYVESLKIAHTFSNERDKSGPYNEGMILSNMGFLLYEQGHLPEATALLSYALQVRQSLHDPAVSAVVDFLNALEQKLGPEAFAHLRSSPSANYNLGTHDLISRLLSSNTQ